MKSYLNGTLALVGHASRKTEVPVRRGELIGEESFEEELIVEELIGAERPVGIGDRVVSAVSGQVGRTGTVIANPNPSFFKKDTPGTVWVRWDWSGSAEGGVDPSTLRLAPARTPTPSVALDRKTASFSEM